MNRKKPERNKARNKERNKERNQQKDRARKWISRNPFDNNCEA